YPFVILFLIVVARSSFFDRWSIPLPLVLVVLLSVALAVVAPFMLRRAAERTRKTALECLNKSRLAAERYATVAPEEPAARARYEHALVKRAQLAELMADIRALNRGAFARWHEQPVVRALAIP